MTAKDVGGFFGRCKVIAVCFVHTVMSPAHPSNKMASAERTVDSDEFAKVVNGYLADILASP